MRRAAAALAAAVLVTTAGCGDEDPGGARRAAPTADGAFVVRYAQHVQVGRALAQAGAKRSRDRRVRSLARAMTTQRKRTFEALTPLQPPASDDALADLGVGASDAAEDLTPTALDGVTPFDPAFLATMDRHARGAQRLLKAILIRGKSPQLQALARREQLERARERSRIAAAIARLRP